MDKVIVVLPDDHPQSKAHLQQMQCPDCRSKAENLAKNGPVLCPYCFGRLPLGSRFCAWCTLKIQHMQS